MASQNKEAKTTKEKELVFVTWNTNGIKNTRRSPQKFSKLLTSLSKLEANVAFLQETHVGTDCYKILENVQNWKAYFTVHSSCSKGVAILIKDSVPFEYICHDEDCCGGYIVLFCRLYGEMYTLVNVYNHKADRIVLGRLKEYLMETAEGVLVVGGDFNTVLHPMSPSSAQDSQSCAISKYFTESLDPSYGQSSSSSKNLALIDILQNFTASLKLKDTWSYLHRAAEGFTWHQNEKHSRIDMFFLKEHKMSWVTTSKVEKNIAEVQGISDHYPLVLNLRFQAARKCPNVTPRLKKLEYNSDRRPGKVATTSLKKDRRPGKISAAELLSAVKSLPVLEELSPETLNVNDCMTSPSLSLSLDRLKTWYNDILKEKQVPKYFKHLDRCKDVRYLTFSEVLAKRLSAFISLGRKSVFNIKSVIVIFDRSPQNIRWSFMETIFERLDHCYKQPCSKYAPFVPPPDFGILQSLLPKTQSSSRDLRDLQPGCPLTSAILSLALDRLDTIVSSETECKTRVSYDKQILFIETQQSKEEQVVGLINKFKDDSGVQIKVI